MNRFALLTVCVSLLSLAACSNAKEQLGIAKKAPDEFAVVKRAPLAMPPDYNLRPPRPGAPRPQEATTAEEAKQAVIGAETQTSTPLPSTSEGLLLHKAGAHAADPDIRHKVDSETATLHDRNKPVAEKLLGLGGDADVESATVVDAPKEAERIRKNAEEGKPVTEGETPSIEE